jgi:aminoglycoside 6'-N-acetyltransferase I
MSEVTIRRATEQDLPQWVRLRGALWPDCGTERHRLEVQQLMAKGNDGVVLVAIREDGSLCGFAEASVRHDHVDGAGSVPVAYLEAWYVDADFRGRGLGRQLLAAVEDWGIGHGLSELASDAELNNQAAIDVHASCGFSESCRAVHLIKRLDRTGQIPSISSNQLNHTITGQEAKARTFFTAVLGMQEEQKPSILANRGGCWFRSRLAILHVGVEKEFAPQKKAHPALCSTELEVLANRLVGYGYPVEWDEALPTRKRFYTRDPFGNRIEIIQDGEGFSQR